MSDLENKSFDYNFAKPFVDEKYIEFNVIHVSNSKPEESKDLYRILFMDLKTLKVLKILLLTRLPRKTSRIT
jgi:hypothetical protein